MILCHKSILVLGSELALVVYKIKDSLLQSDHMKIVRENGNAAVFISIYYH